MDVRNLIKMANQIGDFFHSAAKPGFVEGDIAGHIKRFWDPRMRREIVAYVDNEGGEGLKPEVLTAIVQHREALCGGKKTIRQEFRFVGPPGASDAG
jgi:formate dehydrogenase subunit delta